MEHLGTQEIETKRLLLCEFDKADYHEVFENWAGDLETTKFLTWQAHATEADTRRYLAEVNKRYWRDDYYHWKIMHGADIVGCIEVTDADERSGHCELGWVTAKAWRGQGFMTEAATAVCRFLLGQVGYNRVEAYASVENPASTRVMEKIGMKKEGVLRSYFRLNSGKMTDIAIYSMLRADFLHEFQK